MSSEVAILRAAIETEYRAGTLGLYGLAVVGRHAIITKRAENLSPLLMACMEELGPDMTSAIMEEFEAKYTIGDEDATPTVQQETHETGSAGLPSLDGNTHLCRK